MIQLYTIGPRAQSARIAPSILVYISQNSPTYRPLHQTNNTRSFRHLTPTSSHSLSPIHISLAVSSLLSTDAPFHTNRRGSISRGAGRTSARSMPAACAIAVVAMLCKGHICVNEHNGMVSLRPETHAFQKQSNETSQTTHRSASILSNPLTNPPPPTKITLE